MKIVENALIVVGLLLVTIPIALSGYASYSQRVELDKQTWLKPAKTMYAGQRDHATAPKQAADLAEKQPAYGAGIAVLEIPALHARYAVLEGTSWINLAKGPTRLSESAMIGARGSTVIAGHRTMYGAPFHDLNNLKPGNTLYLYTKNALYLYQVKGLKKVQPDDMRDVKRNGTSQLILSTCEPLFSARYRLLAICDLVEVEALS